MYLWLGIARSCIYPMPGPRWSWSAVLTGKFRIWSGNFLWWSTRSIHVYSCGWTGGTACLEWKFFANCMGMMLNLAQELTQSSQFTHDLPPPPPSPPTWQVYNYVDMGAWQNSLRTGYRFLWRWGMGDLAHQPTLCAQGLMMWQLDELPGTPPRDRWVGSVCWWLEDHEWVDFIANRNDRESRDRSRISNHKIPWMHNMDQSSRPHCFCFLIQGKYQTPIVNQLKAFKKRCISKLNWSRRCNVCIQLPGGQPCIWVSTHSTLS